MPLINISGPFYCSLERHGLQLIWRNALGGYDIFKEQDLNEGLILGTTDRYEMDAYIEARKVLEAVLERNLECGFISPSGQYYSCRNHRHGALIYDVIGEENYIAERGCWIKIVRDGWNAAYQNEGPSDLQYEILKRIGRSPDNKTERDKTLRYQDAFPDGNKVMDELFARFEKIVQTEQQKFKPLRITPAQVCDYL